MERGGLTFTVGEHLKGIRDGSILEEVMTPKQFNRTLKATLAPMLSGAGFESSRSRHSTFYRRTERGIYHIIMPDPGRCVSWFDVKVFAWSSVLEPDGEARFPDGLGVPTDLNCFLSNQGVGDLQQRFRFDTEAELQSALETEVWPLLSQLAIPFLQSIESLEDLYPLIVSPFQKAAAAAHVLPAEEAVEFLDSQIGILLTFDSDEERVVSTISYLQKLRMRCQSS